MIFFIFIFYLIAQIGRTTTNSNMISNGTPPPPYVGESQMLIEEKNVQECPILVNAEEKNLEEGSVSQWSIAGLVQLCKTKKDVDLFIVFCKLVFLIDLRIAMLVLNSLCIWFGIEYFYRACETNLQVWLIVFGIYNIVYICTWVLPFLDFYPARLDVNQNIISLRRRYVLYTVTILHIHFISALLIGGSILYFQINKFSN